MTVERVVTSGVFSLDGGDYEVDNNIWLWTDPASGRLVVVDAAHDARPIIDAVAGRDVDAVVCTHGHNDHINAAVELADAVDAPVLVHPADRMLWDVVHPGRAPDGELADGQVVAGLTVLHTPGHSPGGVCLAADGVVFSGDTLFNGGPGATGRSFSDYPTILDSIWRRLVPLGPETVVHTGHGDDTTIAAEVARLPQAP